MRRVLAFLEWKAGWWDRQREVQLNISPDILEGVCAYATKQANINQALATSFDIRWRAELTQDQGHGKGMEY
ncbi:MAG TPA: hypothetical protein VHV10_06985 [Ktedonobacteraceae bacterium]|nr:hypothetical protein [Ktedonobacteraceae bacterium]